MSEGAFEVHMHGFGKDYYIKEVHYAGNSSSDLTFHVTKGAPSALEVTISSRGARVQGAVLNEENLAVAGVWVVAIPEGDRRKLHDLYKSENTDQYGHFDLRGLAPGKYKLFSWDGVEYGEWEDPEFLKSFEDKGLTIDVQEGDAQTSELKLIAVKESATAEN